ncbi:hypothetical protein WHZ77_06015 [Bradyrhizobium sp. A5]|uniref:hypothetical protein n=1 Tax=Bradyrhizobium sp. A5 TaxID=3133696 RepID=UPI003250D486
MRSVISTIMSAFKALARVGLALVSAPFRMLSGAVGPVTREPIPEVAPPVETTPEAPVDHTETYRKIAIALQGWAAESILADEPQPVPTSWPRSVQVWAQGLDREEAFAIIDAPESAVVGHISSLFAMPRVRALQSLRTAKWAKQEPMSDPCSAVPGLAATAAAL